MMPAVGSRTLTLTMRKKTKAEDEAQPRRAELAMVERGATE